MTSPRRLSAVILPLPHILCLSRMGENLPSPLPTAASRSKGENMGKEGKKKKTDLGEQEDQEEVHILHLPHNWLIALQGETLGRTPWKSPPLLG